ncbi:unnamed protein product [Dicrocoelium dendriticum]|nr:unnamed protein product [Dicrocoelium dendriticum]
MEGTCPVRCLFNSNHCCCSTLDDFYQPSNAVTELEQVCRRELERFRKLYNFDLETMRPVQPIGEGVSGVTFTGYDRMPWRWEQLHTSSDHVPLFYWSQTRGTSGTRLNSKISKSEPKLEPKKARSPTRRSSKSSAVSQGSQPFLAHLQAANQAKTACMKAGTPTIFSLWSPRIQRCSDFDVEPNCVHVKSNESRTPSDDNLYAGSHAQLLRLRSCDWQSDEKPTVGRVVASRGHPSNGRSTEKFTAWTAQPWTLTSSLPSRSKRPQP